MLGSKIDADSHLCRCSRADFQIPYRRPDPMRIGVIQQGTNQANQQRANISHKRNVGCGKWDPFLYNGSSMV